MAECKAEVKALKAALEKEGVRVIVVGELPGEDLLEAVVQGMAEADLFIIMGTETVSTELEFNYNKETKLLEFMLPEETTSAHEVTVAWDA